MKVPDRRDTDIDEDVDTRKVLYWQFVVNNVLLLIGRPQATEKSTILPTRTKRTLDRDGRCWKKTRLHGTRDVTGH